MKMRHFFDVVYMYDDGTDIERSVEFDDYDHANAFFIQLSEEDPDSYNYAVMREVNTDYDKYEEIETLKEYYKEC